MDAYKIFEREWTRSQIREMVHKNCYLDIGKHEDMKVLCCVPYSEEEKADYYELKYVVPTDWLIEKARDLFGVNGIQKWLEDEYISEESELIFVEALRERKVVMVDFN